MPTNHTILRRTRNQVVLTAAVLTLSLSSIKTHAEPWFPIARENPSVVSDFTLDFGGVQTTGQVISTDMVLKLDPETGTSRLLQYDQKVEPLQIPIGPDIFLDTGEITVVAQFSLGGYYDGRSNNYGTNDVYAVYFEGDLSALGIESPFILPSTSEGTLAFDPNPAGAGPATGQLDLVWEGQGELANPQNPDEPIEFAYVCRVFNDFVVYEQSDFDGDQDVDRDDLEFLMGCYSGAVSYDNPHCELADFNLNKRIDIADIAAFMGDLNN